MSYDQNELLNNVDGSQLEENKYQVYVNDISWNPNQIQSYQARASKNVYDYKSLPKSLTFDVPATIIAQADKNKKNTIEDIIEQFIYSSLTRKFLHEVYSCQIWILW